MELKHCFLAPMLKAKPRDERVRSMVRTQLFKSAPSWIKPVVVISLALLVSFGCKEQSSSSQPPPTGMPPPPSGGMPAPPSGGMPPPPSPSSGSPGDGMPQPPSPSSGSQGEGSESTPTDSSQGGEESSGEVGSFPAEEADGPPPMPGTGGAGEGAEAGAEESTSAGGESEESSDWDEESQSEEECGDTGSLPGGVGGMGQDGECIGGGAAASESDSESESSSDAVQGTGGAGEVAEFPTESDEERAERLGQELDKSIGGFDEVLMEEQQEISSVGRNMEGFGEGLEGDGGISLGQQAGGSSGGITVANNGSLPQPSIGSMTDEQIRDRTPEDIPVMVDDDIIARQLREAALSEEDPALRDRLWEEYRKYRGN